MNVFEESDFSQSEDVVIIVENSPAFYRTDILPNRYMKFTELLQNFIQERLKIDYRDRYSLIVFNKNLFIPLEEFENFSQSLINNLQKGVDETELVTDIEIKEWSSVFIQALQKAIQKCINTFKKIGNKTLRIIIFTNKEPKLSKTFISQIQTVIERTAQRLDIIIDVLYIKGSSNTTIFEFENPYKIVSSMTGGDYHEIKNAREFEQAFKKITKKKEMLRKDYLGERKYTQEKQFLEIIASSMEKITELLADSELKCQVCFKNSCSCETLDAYEHLRRCPNCKKIFHECCAGKWAEQQNSKSSFIGFPNVFRCPYCFYLLKVPREYVRFDAILYHLQEKWLRQKEENDQEQRETEQKEKEVQEFMKDVEEKQSNLEKITIWLTEKLPDKSHRDIEYIAKDIINLPNNDEMVSFINYLKFKENIDDDSMPI